MSQTRIFRYAWIGIIGFVLACTCGTLGTTGTKAPSANSIAGAGNATLPAGEASGPTEVFPRTPDPVTVHAVLDSAHTFSNAFLAEPGVAYMSQIGGKINAGVEVTLQLPGGLLALDQDDNLTPAFGTTVTATPVSSIPDIPFQKGYLAAIHIAPEGLQMVEPASLSFTLQGEYAATDLVGFAADGTGADFHLFPVLTSSGNGITLVYFSVIHFSLYGVAQATAAEIEAQHKHPPAKPENQADDDLAPLIPVGDDLAPLKPVLTPNQLKVKKNHDHTVKPDLDKLSKLNCNQVGAAAMEFENWNGMVNQFGFQDTFKDQISADGQALMTRLKECIKIACPPCLGKGGSKKSANDFIILAAFAESIDRILGNSDEANYWLQLANKCAENAGIVQPQPPVASCGSDCPVVQSPTPLVCP
jgi:hypothetical protein